MRRSRWLLTLLTFSLAFGQSKAQYTYTTQFGSGQINGFTTSLAVDASNNVYVGDYSGVTRFDSATSYTSSSTLISGLSGNDIPRGITIANNALYVGDASTVNVYNLSGAYQSTFNNPPSSGQTTGIGHDSSGRIFTANNGVGINVYNGDGTYSNSFPVGVYNNPLGVGVDRGSSVYITENGPDGSYLHKYDSLGNALGNVNVSVLVGNYYTNYGVAIDSKGDVFIAGDQAGYVYELDQNFNLIQTLGNGLNDGSSPIQNPYALAVDSQDNLFISTSSSLGVASIVEFSPPASVPEPSSFILCGLLATGGLGGYFWRRGRQRKLVGPAIA